MGESFDTHRTLLIEGVFRCKLERFILALAASTERAILMFWFQKEEEKSTKKTKTKKRGAGVVSNSTHY